MIHLLDSDPRQFTDSENYKYNHGSLSSVMININNEFKKNGLYAHPDQAQWVGICDGLNVGFKYKDKESFVISCWEMANTLPMFMLQTARNTNQKLIGMSNQITNLWRKYGFECSTIHLGADTNFWYQSKDKNKDKFVFILPLATFLRSGIDLSIEAFNLAFNGNKNVILKIKDTESNDIYKNKIEQYKNKGCNIEYYSGRWSMQELRDFYSSAHVCLSLQRSASFGLVITESMACNTLNITADAPPFNEFLNNDISLLVKTKGLISINSIAHELINNWGFMNNYGNFQYPEEPLFYDFDIYEYAKIMKKAYDDWDFLYKKQYRKYIIDNYTWEKTANNLKNILYNT